MTKRSVWVLIGVFVSSGLINGGRDGATTSGRRAAMSKERENVQGLESEQTPRKEESRDDSGGASFYTPSSSTQGNAAQEEFKGSVRTHDFLSDEEISDYEEYASKAAAIWQALRENDISSLESLLGKGVDVDESDSEDLTLLHHAARQGQTKIVQLLLSCGADANARNLYGYTPLMSAAESGHTDVVRLLLANGADVDVETSIHTDGKSPSTLTAMKLAVDNAHTDIVELLKQAGASH